MVGIVIVSHSQKLAEGVVDLASLMAPETPMRAAGGMDDGGFGTSFEKISTAIDEIYSDDGVIILMDMGSAVMTTEMVLEDLGYDDVFMVDCPIAEGAIAATLASCAGADLAGVKQEALSSKTADKL